MVKSKFPGKPSKIVQRSLVRAFSVVIPSCDSSLVSEGVYLGLSIFDRTFGSNDEISSFKGFSSAEIEDSLLKKEQFVSQVKKKWAHRGINFTSGGRRRIAVPTSDVHVDPEEISDILKSDIEIPPVSCKREPRKCGKIWLLSKKASRYHSKMQMRHNFKTLTKNSLLRFKHKSSNYLSDKYCRKFVLPSRSVHSSRVIKPNKRFIDPDKNLKTKLLLKNFKTHKYEAEAKRRVTRAGNHSDNGNSSAVTSSKVIIREARLNVSTDTAIAGPFSVKKAISLEKDKFKSGVITCGICGAVRHYKYILQTKKFGVYSCEPCRRFILRMIKQSKQTGYEVLKCQADRGIGKCVISSGSVTNEKLSGESCSRTVRCQACWLILCLQKYTIPCALRKMLVRLIPEDLKTFSSFVSFKSQLYDPDCEDNSPSSVKNEIHETNDTLKKRLRFNQFFKTYSFNKRLMEKNETATSKTRSFLFKKNAPNCKTSLKSKWLSENSLKETIDKELLVPRGPRIKHVCRSASSVLKTSFSSNKSRNASEFCCISSESDSTFAEPKEVDDEENLKQDTAGKCVPYDESSDGNEFSAPQQGARSLQDFCKESSDEFDENDDKLISIDFWEAYDPDEIFKTGFPLIGSEPTNVRALCFLCGSAGLEKLLHCVSCCEAYHWFCAEGPSLFREEVELDKCRVNWVCRKCKVCSVCGEKSSRPLISCQRCRHPYHSECLTSKALNKRLFNSDRPWVCPSCLKCKSCNLSSVITFVGNIPLCSQCFKLRQKGNFCPLCQGCYQDEDYNVQMMECGVCKCWIHARCEGISDEKYQILSFLPESIEFVCRLCCSVPPAQWWLAVEDELKTGYLGILKHLCKNKRMNELFKESPRKHIACRCSPQPILPTSVDSQRSDDGHNAIAASSLASVKRSLNFMDAGGPITSTGDDNDANETVNDNNTTPENNVYSCEVCTARNESHTKINQRLLAVKNNVHDGRYESLSAFHDDLENVIVQIDEGRLLQTYRNSLKQFFPWFDTERARCAKQEDNLPDWHAHDAYTAAECCEQSNSSEENYEHLRRLMAADEYKYENHRMLDVRTCIFCKSMGEAVPSKGGRLVYCGRNEWVHSNCALWSSEVFEEIDGSLQNVHSAIGRGRQIRCSLCEKKGASVGCCYKNCGLTYHFACARKARCKFFHNKTIYCGAHEAPEDAALSLLVHEKDFEILRPVYVEMDRKKKKLECHANVKLRIGSLLVESLGKIDPHLSDNANHIIPIYFRCTRLFWSTSKPWKIVQYCIQIKMRYSYETTPAEFETNFTVDHSTREQIVQQVVDDLVRKVCAGEDRRMAVGDASGQGQADLLFPELQDAIYKDLPNDFLNDNTLHDIWNNYDNVDDEVCSDEDEASRDDDLDVEKTTFSTRKSVLLDREKTQAKLVGSNGGDRAEGKYLRDKNNVIRDLYAKHRANKGGVDSWYKQLRCKMKRKMNFENSTTKTTAMIAKKKKFENYISPSKLGDVLEYYSSYKNILQLDGMVDIYNDEEPVKCVQCHRTYRTTLSFERHLETCNVDFSDYMISSCESDSASSEEEKFSNPADMLNTAFGTAAAAVAPPPAINGIAVASHIRDDAFVPKYASNLTAAYIVDSTERMVPTPAFGANLCANVTYGSVYPTYTAATFEEARLMENAAAAAASNTVTLQTLLPNDLKAEALTAVAAPPPITVHAVDPSVKVNFVANGHHGTLVADKVCGAGYATTPHLTFAASLPQPQYELQNVAPTYVIQSFPKTEIIPTYVALNNPVNECLHAETFLSHPPTLQLQPMQTASVNLQSIVPTIVGAIVQPNVAVETTPTYLVNTGAGPATAVASVAPATTELFATAATAPPHSTNIILPNQSVLFGLETVVSNTIMSSSQFLAQSPAGNMGASAMYSSTTTQVFQAAKPMPQSDFGGGGGGGSYIVLNPQTSAPAMLHASLPPQQPSVDVIAATKEAQRTVTAARTLPNTGGGDSGYMYVHVNQIPVSVANDGTAIVLERKRPVIMKPVKASVAHAKKSVKIMKVKNNRPIGVEVKHAAAAVTAVKPPAPWSPLVDAKIKTLQIKTTDKPIVLGQPGQPNNALPDSVGKSASGGELRSIDRLPVQLIDDVRPPNSVPPPPKITSADVTFKCVSVVAKDALKTHPPLPPPAMTMTTTTTKTTGPVRTISSYIPPRVVNMTSVGAAQPSPSYHAEVERSLGDAKAPLHQSTRPLPSVADANVAVRKATAPPFVNRVAQPPPPLSSPSPRASSPPPLSSPSPRASSPPPLSSPSPRSSSPPLPSANEAVTSPPVASSTTRTAAAIAQSETERLFDELMRQHLENERRRKQKMAAPSDRTELPSTPAKNCDVRPAPSPETRPVAAVDASTPAAGGVFYATPSNVSPTGGDCGDAKSPLKTKYKPRISPRLPDGGASGVTGEPSPKNDVCGVTGEPSPKNDVCGVTGEPSPKNDVCGVAGDPAPKNGVSAALAGDSAPKNGVSAALAIKKMARSPEKENKMAVRVGPAAPSVTAMTAAAASPLLGGNEVAANKSWKTASVSYEVNAEDGFSYKTNNLLDLWNKILESVQQSRAKYKLPLLPKNASLDSDSVYGLLGFENNASKYLLEQLPDAWKCIFYKPAFHKTPLKNGKTTPVENETGCARSEPFASSYKYDMFGWLASRHRKPPKFMMISDSDIVNGNRRITSPNLPMAMRFRHLKETAKEAVGVFRSDIHGRGLFCLRDIDAGEMVIEYAGEVIRSTLTDKREKQYTSKGIGCYMFRIDDRFVVDATMCGNAARFINHSCEPNCYSRIVDILGKKHILIFALRRIPKGEELTYDYKFPLEDEKIFCHCLSRKCRKYLN